jgi:hypothetical protein
MITLSSASKITGGVVAVLASAAMVWLPGLPAVAARSAAHAAASQAMRHGGLDTAVTRPPGRQNDSFAFDPRHDDFVMFGGQTATAVLGDTWLLKDGTWTQLHPAQAPSARTGAALVFDPATCQLLLFGGSGEASLGSGGYSNQTWVWTGTTWRQLHPATSPPARHNTDMIYDAATHDVILFGGYSGTGYFNDTWSWNGTTWTQLSTPTSPSPRDSGAFVYDPTSQSAILYGGFSFSTGRLDDTWSWNGTAWTQLSPATSPGLTSVDWQAAYDAASGQVLLFGGDTDAGPPASGTWTWTGTTWQQLIPALNPPGLGGGTMTYDSTSKRIFLFGGYADASETVYPNDTWTWNGTIWNTIG